MVNADGIDTFYVSVFPYISSTLHDAIVSQDIPQMSAYDAHIIFTGTGTN